MSARIQTNMMARTEIELPSQLSRHYGGLKKAIQQCLENAEDLTPDERKAIRQIVRDTRESLEKLDTAVAQQS